VSHLTVRPDQIPTKAKERELLSLRDTVNSFKQLLTDEKFADLDILTPTKTFKAHKLVLCGKNHFLHTLQSILLMLVVFACFTA